MKKLICLFIVCLFAVEAFSQIEVSKFKLYKNEPLGMNRGNKGIELKFTNTSGKSLKYVNIHYYIINKVGDVISGNDYGIQEDGKEYIKANILSCTGPFEDTRSYKRVSGNVLNTLQKDIIAFPYQIEYIFMGSNQSHYILITKDNLNKFFPKIEWVDYNRYNKAL